MLLQLAVAVVVEASDSSVLDGSVHPLDLAVGPRVVDLGEAVLDAVGIAAMANMWVTYHAVGPSA